jgi:hypothetical protein
VTERGGRGRRSHTSHGDTSHCLLVISLNTFPGNSPGGFAEGGLEVEERVDHHVHHDVAHDGHGVTGARQPHTLVQPRRELCKGDKGTPNKRELSQENQHDHPWP